MSKKLFLLLAILLLVAPLITMACDTPPPPPEDPCCEDPCGCPPPPPPPPASCTPGFWKQDQHFQYWVGYKPTDMYNATMTLLDALQGGKATRESRFIVTGWLNAANPTAPCY
jgi:hypothetical protein